MNREQEPELAIWLDQLYKDFPVLQTPWEKFTFLYGLIRNNQTIALSSANLVRALKGVSLQIWRGQRVGLIGRNGAGKTTLLRLISGNSQPTSGRIQLAAPVYNLVGDKIGFEPEISARDNAWMYLHLHGVPASKIAARVEEIQDFVELGDYFQQPIKHLSLGMRMRAEFATATAIGSEIIAIDEVLGAGDPYWIEKCARRLESLCAGGSTVLLVSHSLDQIMRYCDRTIWLEQGQVRMDGPTVEVVRHYETFLEQLTWLHDDQDDQSINLERLGLTTGLVTLDHPDCPIQVLRFPGLGDVYFSGIWLNGQNQTAIAVSRDQSLSLRFCLTARKIGHYRLRYLVTFWTGSGKRLAIAENEFDAVNLGQGDNRWVSLELQPGILGEGEYYLSFSLFNLMTHASTSQEKDTRLDMLWKSHRLKIMPQQIPQPLASNQADARHLAPLFTIPVQIHCDRPEDNSG